MRTLLDPARGDDLYLKGIHFGLGRVERMVYSGLESLKKEEA